MIANYDKIVEKQIPAQYPTCVIKFKNDTSGQVGRYDTVYYTDANGSNKTLQMDRRGTYYNITMCVPGCLICSSASIYDASVVSGNVTIYRVDWGSKGCVACVNKAFY